MTRLASRALLLAGIIFLALSGAASAASREHYLQEGSLPPDLLVPPPQEGSEPWKLDMLSVESAQERIKPQDMDALKEEQHLRIELMTRLLGDGVTREKMPALFVLLDNVMADAGRVVDADKKFWHTRRPYLADKDVKLLVDPIDENPAYPSGHTCTTRVLAEVLGMIYPNRRADLRRRADDVAWHRVQAGVHSPTDLAGGKALAMLILGGFMQSEAFQKDLTAARLEATRR